MHWPFQSLPTREWLTIELMSFLKDLAASLGFPGFGGALKGDTLYDPVYGSDLTMAENIVLLANGGITDSLLLLVSAEEPPEVEDTPGADVPHT